MAIRYYDEALYNKLRKWVKDINAQILKPEEVSELFKVEIANKQDKPITLPLIALSRDTDIQILNSNKKPLSYDGLNVTVLDENNNEVKTDSVYKINAIPIQITYQLDIYTKKLVEADEYVRNFVFNFINYPKIDIVIPYNDVKLKHESTVYLSQTIQDNSDIPQRLFPGQFSRFTLELTIDNAYLFSIPVKDNITIEEATVEIKNIESDTENVEDFIIDYK